MSQSCLFFFFSYGQNNTLYRDVKLIFMGGHISLAVAFKGPNVILGMYKCNYSLTGKWELSAAMPPGRNKVPGQIK